MKNPKRAIDIAQTGRPPLGVPALIRREGEWMMGHLFLNPKKVKNPKSPTYLFSSNRGAFAISEETQWVDLSVDPIIP